MASLFQNILTASFHGSIVILAVLVLRLLLRKAPRKYICYLWLLAGLRLLLPFAVQSELSLQPQALPEIRWNLSGALPLCWAAIASVFVIYSGCSYVSLKRKVRGAVKIPGGWESSGIDTAFILGFIKPRIYIPTGMADTTRKHILSHERTHLDKGDHWIKMIGFLALALHWFNPLVWIAYVLLCKDIEMACDERVVQFMELPERKEYSTALLDCSSGRIHYAASPVAFGEVSVKSRILSILNYRKPSFWMGLLSVAAIAFVALCLVTSPTEPVQVIQIPVEETTTPTQAPELAPPPEEPVSPWGVHMVAEVSSPTSMSLYSGVEVAGIPWDGTTIEKPRTYWIESWDGKAWNKLPLLVTNPRYEGCYATDFSKDNIHRFYLEDTLDWTLLYGTLPEGDYRIGMTMTRQGETMDHYAQFHIWANSLTGEESQAIARCETALDLLAQKDTYSITLYEGSKQGQLLPKQTLFKANGRGRVDSYIGDICYSSYYCDLTEGLLDHWDEDFRLRENKCITFPEGESCISEEQVEFITQWETSDGTPCRERNIFTFGEDGRLIGANRHSQLEHKAMTVSTAYYDDTLDTTQMPKDSQAATQDSPWKIFFRVDDDYLSPTGGEVWLAASETIGVVTYTTDSSYWLERKSAQNWESLPSSGGDPNWGAESYRLSSRTKVIDRVDWSAYYGSLEPGLYRMGKRFYNGEESIIQYAEFLIYPQGSIVGKGGEEAIARINAAVEQIKTGSYHITCTEGGSYGVDPELSTVFWMHDGVCVTDYYDYQRYDGYRHSSVNDDPSDTLFYHFWTVYLDWLEPRTQVYFAPGASSISKEQISFTTVPTGNDRIYMPTHYTVSFDKDGSLHSIEYYGDHFGTERKTTLTFLNTPVEEIAAWVQEKQAEQG